MKPMEEITMFWHVQCREHNVCTGCHKKHICGWAFKEIKKNGENKE